MEELRALAAWLREYAGPRDMGASDWEQGWRRGVLRAAAEAERRAAQAGGDTPVP